MTSGYLDTFFKPRILRLDDVEDHKAFTLLKNDRTCYSCDQIYSQLKELIKSRNPGNSFTGQDYTDLIAKHLNGKELSSYGVWVHYAWNNTLVHLLDEDEFIEVRTNRNREKITVAEQLSLKQKKIGIAGLSVGQSIALTLAMERICGELRLADFDTLELSNINRLRSSVRNIGLPKTIIAAREIAEIDPFITVKVYNEGLVKTNFDSFFCDDGNLDLFVEVCDSLEVKIESRLKAKKLKIPVVMDTNDRGMLDIERFDLEPERKLFHGLIEQFDDNDGIRLTPTNRTEVLKALVSFESLSERMKLSMAQINKTITTWPQLASSVVLGGAITTDVARKILLGQHRSSGRYYVDLDQLIS